MKLIVAGETTIIIMDGASRNKLLNELAWLARRGFKLMAIRMHQLTFRSSHAEAKAEIEHQMHLLDELFGPTTGELPQPVAC